MRPVKSVMVEFIGGPICGKRGRVPLESLATYVGYVVGEREYLYQHSLKQLPGKPFKFGHKYYFLGHDAQLPPGVEEVT